MKTLFLSVGHNWGKNWKAIDKWAQTNWTNEATEVNSLIDQVIEKWIPWVKIIKVPLSLNLKQRIDWINKSLSHVIEPFAIEFHMDSFNTTSEGASVWYNDDNAFTKLEWWQFLQKYTEITWLKSRHVNSDTTNRHGQLWFVSELKCASLLIELGFISNPVELKKMREKSVDSIIKSIINMNSK